MTKRPQIDQIADDIRRDADALDPDQLSPRDALTLIYEWWGTLKRQ